MESSLTMSAVSSGFRAHSDVHSKRAPFRSRGLFCHVQPKARSQSLRSRTQSDPTISSITTAIMITISNSPAKGSGMPNHFSGDLLHTLAISGLSRVRTELFQLFVVPSLAPHPVKSNGELAGHRDLGDPPFPSHRQVQKPATPIGIASHGDLCRLHQ